MPPYDLDEDGEWEELRGDALGMILILAGVMVLALAVVVSFWLMGYR